MDVSNTRILATLLLKLIKDTLVEFPWYVTYLLTPTEDGHGL